MKYSISEIFYICHPSICILDHFTSALISREIYILYWISYYLVFVVVNMPRRSERANVVQDNVNTLAARAMSNSMQMIASDVDSSNTENI